jgi:hypothetical protein
MSEPARERISLFAWFSWLPKKTLNSAAFQHFNLIPFAPSKDFRSPTQTGGEYMSNKNILQIILIMVLSYAIAGCAGNKAADNERVNPGADDAARNMESAPSTQPTPYAPSETESKPRPEYTPQQKSERNSVPAARESTAAPRQAASPRASQRTTVSVPAGTKITVALIDRLSTETNKAGDTFSASLAEPIVVDGNEIVDKGTTVRGRIQRVVEPGKVKGRAVMEMVLTDITDGNRTIKFPTEPFSITAEDNKDRDAGIIAGGAGVGAVIGGIAGGKEGAAIGAILGGGSGTAAVLATRGQELELDSETRINFVLAQSVRLPVLRKTT